MGRGLLAVVVASSDAKSSWPELVGRHVVVAIAVIKSQRQDVVIKLLDEGDDGPRDLDDHRVCIFLGEGAIVVKTPVVG